MRINPVDIGQICARMFAWTRKLKPVLSAARSSLLTLLVGTIGVNPARRHTAKHIAKPTQSKCAKRTVCAKNLGVKQILKKNAPEPNLIERQTLKRSTREPRHTANQTKKRSAQDVKQNTTPIRKRSNHKINHGAMQIQKSIGRAWQTFLAAM